MKANTTISIEGEILELAKKMYPRQLSQLVEEHLRTLIRQQEDITEQRVVEDYDQEIDRLNELILRQKLQMKALREAKEAKERQETQELNQQLDQAGRLKEGMDLADRMGF